jgi:hypothetical protein
MNIFSFWVIICNSPRDSVNFSYSSVKYLLLVTVLILSLLLHFFYIQKGYKLIPKSQQNNRFNGAGRNVNTLKRPKAEYKMEEQIPLK